MIFEENKIPYFQDHRFYRGVPTGIDFVCELKQAILGDMPGGYLKLTAPGYGINGNYGNGSLFLKLADLPEEYKMIKRPIPKIDVKYSRLTLEICQDYIRQLDETGSVQEDLKQYIFENVMLDLFGHGIFNWINSRM